MNYFVFIGIVCLVVSLLFLLPAIVVSKSDKDTYYSPSIFDNVFGASCIGLTFIGGFILFVIFVSRIDIDRKFETTINEYNILKDVVESYKNGDTQWVNENNVYSINIHKEIIQMNKTIDKHKTYYDSRWYGLWHSEEIGNLEHLKL